MLPQFRATFEKVWFIVAVAFCVRVALVLFYEATTSRQALSVIPFLFEPGNIAFALSHGHGFSSPLRIPTGPTSWMAPVYPLILAAIFKLFGAYTFPAYWAAVLFNIACSALTCIPIFKTGQRVAGPSVAITAAWLWAIFPNAILLPVQSMWDVSLSALLAAVILYRTLTLTRNSAVRDWCLYGLLWGLTLMTNPTLVLLLPFLIGWLSWRLRTIAAPLLALSITVLCCVPWTIRNYLVFDSFIPFRSVLGLQLWVGNNERVPDLRPGEVHPLSSSTERESYRRMGELAYMQSKKSDALDFIISHPKVEAELTWVRFVETWTGGTPHPIRDFFHTDSVEFRAILLFNLLAAVGTFVGLGFVLQNRDPHWFPLSTFPLLLPIPAYLTLSSARYRHPIDPAILLLTAVAIHHVRFAKVRFAKPRVPMKSPEITTAPSSEQTRYALEDQAKMTAAANYFLWQNRLVTRELGRKVVEVGCGIGNFTRFLLDHDAVYALDFDPSCVERLQSRYPDQPNLHVQVSEPGHPTFAALSRHKPDSCVCLNVLEHIEDDLGALRSMADVVIPGGVIVLWVPAFPSLYGPIDRNLHHFRRYTRRSMLQVATAAGLQVRKLHYLNCIGFFGWWANARIFRREEQSLLQIQVFDRLVVPWLSRLEDCIHPPFGQSLFAVLQKP